MGWACGTYGRTEMVAVLWWGNLEIQGIVGRVILKDIEQRGGRVGSGFIWPNIDTSGGLF
jgi:hypothetical protein